MNKNINYKQLIVKTTFFLYLFSIFLIQNSTLNLNSSLSDMAENVKVLFMLLCIIFAVFFNKFSLYELIIIFVISLPLIVTRVLTGNSPLLDLLIVILGLKNVPLRSLLNIFLVTQVFSGVMIIILRLMSIIPDRVLIRDGVLRSSLGFWHPNTAGLTLLCIFLLTLSLYKGNKMFFIILFNILGIAMYGSTNSRTSVVLIFSTSILTFFNYIMKEKKMNIFMFKYFIPVTFVSILSMSIAVSLLYFSGNPFINELNTLLSNRISIGSRFIQEYGFSLFGKTIEYSSSNYQTQTIIGFQYRVLDNVYLKYLLNYGVITIVYLGVYLILISRKLEKNYLVSWNLYCIIFLVFGIMEQSALNYVTNFFLVFGVIIFNTNENKEFLNKL